MCVHPCAQTSQVDEVGAVMKQVGAAVEQLGKVVAQRLVAPDVNMDEVLERIEHRVDMVCTNVQHSTLSVQRPTCGGGWRVLGVPGVKYFVRNMEHFPCKPHYNW